MLYEVITLGVRNDVNKIMQAMDVFVFPSLFEGLGIVAIEAQAAGLPCVLSDQIPNESYLTKSVISIPLESPPKYWAEKILNSVESFERKNNYEIIENAGYDIISVVKKLEQLYKNKLENEL